MTTVKENVNMAGPGKPVPAKSEKINILIERVNALRLIQEDLYQLKKYMLVKVKETERGLLILLPDTGFANGHITLDGQPVLEIGND